MDRQRRKERKIEGESHPLKRNPWLEEEEQEDSNLADSCHGNSDNFAI